MKRTDFLTIPVSGYRSAEEFRQSFSSLDRRGLDGLVQIINSRADGVGVGVLGAFEVLVEKGQNRIFRGFGYTPEEGERFVGYVARGRQVEIELKQESSGINGHRKTDVHVEITMEPGSSDDVIARCRHIEELKRQVMHYCSEQFGYSRK